MPRHQHNINSQDKMPLPESSTPEKCKISEAQDKDFRIAILYMFKDLKEEIGKFFDEVYENIKHWMK